ncbi:MAG: alanine dehydrogenase [Candidatus Electrothrix sp. GM3_4]|nr:alanine dehydrogenase [Candidatus Electrothrix sp. GM3_4]
MTQLLTVGVIGKSSKENEKRVPIHPEHIQGISQKLREKITFEEGYGVRFGMNDKMLAQLTSGRVAFREEILNGFDCVLLPKPLAEDLSQVREGAIVWGWPHCVQQKEITQVSIERKLTLIAWEEMFTWSRTDEKNMHIFYKNNEMAGYAGVDHALSLTGTTVYTGRPPTEVKDQLPGISFKQVKEDDSGNLLVVEPDNHTRPIAEALSDVHIIVNGTLQDTAHPRMFVPAHDADKLIKGALIIDISCDEGMGFWCAKPTSFEHPMFEAAGKFYYAVDHSPSFYWNSASWEISKALLPFFPEVLGGTNTWEKNKTISKSIEIRNGKGVEK